MAELLSPIGDPDVDYIRMRLNRLHEMNRIIYPSKVWKKMLKCLDGKTTPRNIEDVLSAVFSETLTEEFAREMEFRLVDAHGLERYADPETLRKDIEKAAVKYRVMHVMDTIYESCGHPSTRSKVDRLDDAAWFSVPK